MLASIKNFLKLFGTRVNFPFFLFFPPPQMQLGDHLTKTSVRKMSAARKALGHKESSMRGWKVLLAMLGDRGPAWRLHCYPSLNPSISFSVGTIHSFTHYFMYSFTYSTYINIQCMPHSQYCSASLKSNSFETIFRLIKFRCY